MKRTLVSNSARSAVTRSSTSASTVASRPVVGSSRIEQGRVLGERHRDHRALLHPARQLVRVAAQDPVRVRDLHLREHLARPLVRLCLPGARKREDLRQLGAHAKRRIQGRGGVLVDHRDRRRPEPADIGVAHGEQVLAAESDRSAHYPAVAGQVAHDREGCGGLSAA